MVVQEEQEQQEVSQEEIKKYEEVERAAKKERINEAVQSDSTGTDPRLFSHKWMPYYR